MKQFVIFHNVFRACWFYYFDMLGLPKDISKELTKFLEDDEKPIDFRKEPWSYYKRNRWVVLTNKRIYLIKRTFFGLSFDITQIILSAANFEMIEGVIMDTVYIRDTTGEHIINFFPSVREGIIQFVSEIEKTRDEMFSDLKEAKEDKEKTAAKTELEALARTFYENKISSQEYEAKKKGLIDKL